MRNAAEEAHSFEQTASGGVSVDEEGLMASEFSSQSLYDEEDNKTQWENMEEERRKQIHAVGDVF